MLIKIVGVAVACMLAVSMWFYVDRLLIPFQVADAAAHNSPRGNLSDLYPRWLGVRELLLHGRDPYGPEVTREIQVGYWGRPIDPRRAGDPQDEVRFAYPVYVAFLLAPTVWMQFETVRIVLSWILEVLTVLSIWLWLRVYRWRPSLDAQLIFVLMVLGTYSVVQGIKLQQLSLLVCALIAAGLALMARGRLVAAGIVLACSTIKPQLVVLLCAWLVFWSFNNWCERKRFFWSFTASCALLVLAGEFLLRGWIGRFVQGLIAYQRYAGTDSPLDALTTPLLGAVLGAVVLLGTAAVCWHFQNSMVGSVEFNLVLAIVLAATLAVMPRLAPYNQLLLVPAVIVIGQSWRALWNGSTPIRVISAIAAFFLVWPWIVSLALMIGSFFLPRATVQRAWAAPLWTSPALSIIVLGPLAFLVRNVNRAQLLNVSGQ